MNKLYLLRLRFGQDSRGIANYSHSGGYVFGYNRAHPYNRARSNVQALPYQTCSTDFSTLPYNGMSTEHYLRSQNRKVLDGCVMFNTAKFIDYTVRSDFSISGAYRTSTYDSTFSDPGLRKVYLYRRIY